MKLLPNFFENFIKIITAITIIFIWIGYFDLAFYYNHFNIPIYEYISVSEIVMTSASNIFYLLIYLLFEFILVYLFLWDADAGYINPKNGVITWRFEKTNVINISIAFIIFFLFAPSILIYFTKNRILLECSSFIITLDALTVISCSLGFSLLQFYSDKFKMKLKHPIVSVSLITIFITLTGLVILRNESNLFEIESFHNNNKIRFYLNGNINISTNDSIKYIGKTEKYYFIWNSKSNISTIYPVDEIRKIEIIDFKDSL